MHDGTMPKSAWRHQLTCLATRLLGGPGFGQNLHQTVCVEDLPLLQQQVGASVYLEVREAERL